MDATTSVHREYTAGSKMPFVEDKCHEFKGHTNLCVEDLPKWAFVKGTLRRTRRAISRTLNAFLNSNVDGTVYLGVTDCGTVKGIPVSEHQKGHMLLALGDLMSRYTPVVPKYRYKMEFVPVVGELLVERRSAVYQGGMGYWTSNRRGSAPSGSDGSAGDLLPSANLKPFRDWSTLQKNSHRLRSPRECWCEQETRLLLRQNIQVPHYVIEIHIFPFVPRPDVDPVILQLYPIFEDEEERAYLRGAASVYQVTHQDVAELTKRQVKEHFDGVLRRRNNENAPAASAS